MKTDNKKASTEALNTINSVIIQGKTYKIKELYPVFSVQSLMLASKEDLYKYWQLAIETNVKQFITNVDNVFCKRFPNYE